MRKLSATDIVATLKAKNYAFDLEEGYLNIVGVRGESDKVGTYNDVICGLVTEGDELKLHIWEGTVDPSTSYLLRPINKRGAAILCPGQYLDTWTIDSHNGWCTTLCQRTGKVRVYRDNDRDHTLDKNESTVQAGYYGINFHWDRNEPSGKSGKNYRSSAGCQVFRYKSDHKEFMKLVRAHKEHFGSRFDYTLLREEDIITADEELEETVDLTDYFECFEAPEEEEEEEEDETIDSREYNTDWAKWVIKKEGRFDLNGYLKVYKLPSGDGGGSYEVAGINNKYHPQKAVRLKELIERGRPAQVLREAVEYWTRYTNRVAAWHPCEAVEFFLRDCCCNRGPTGAARILQMAVGAYVDGKIGPETLNKASTYSETDLVLRLLLARQSYERKYANRDETSKFWRGLVNRWVSCAKKALS